MVVDSKGRDRINPYRAVVYHGHHKLVSLGYFETAEEAALVLARHKAAQAAAAHPPGEAGEELEVVQVDCVVDSCAMDDGEELEVVHATEVMEDPPARPAAPAPAPAPAAPEPEEAAPAASAGRAKQTAKRSAPKPAGGSGGGASSRKRQAAAAADSAADEEEDADAPQAAQALRNASADLANAADARGDPVQEVLAGADKRKRAAAAGSSSQQKAAKASAAAPAAAPRATTNPSASAQASSVQWDDDDDGLGVSAPSLNPAATRTIPPLQTTGGTPNGAAAQDGGSPAVPGGPKVNCNAHREVKKTKRVPFSRDEENYVRQGVQKFKDEKQMWVKILKEYPFDPTRTSVDLKDKHRNLMKKQ